MKGVDHKLELRLATTGEDVISAQRLRYRVFVDELGGGGQDVDHEHRLECDRFDPYFDHLILFDHARPVDPIDRAVGVYRIMRAEQAKGAGGFYSENEYELSSLRNSGRKLLELGRSCVDADYRGGTAMYHLWNGLAQYVADYGIEILFGVASFHGTDIDALAEPLSFLHHNHLSPESVRVRVQNRHFQSMNRMPANAVDRNRAMIGMPALIKAYLRVGGSVGEGAFIDREFNTTDVCLVMDTEHMSQRHRTYYAREKSA